jgi:hypothetical protein
MKQGFVNGGFFEKGVFIERDNGWWIHNFGNFDFMYFRTLIEAVAFLRKN